MWDVAPSLSSGPVGGLPNASFVTTLGCLLDSALDVQLLPLTLEAFLSESINLDIMSGNSLSQES